jgi:hypothetical protein
MIPFYNGFGHFELGVPAYNSVYKYMFEFAHHLYVVSHLQVCLQQWAAAGHILPVFT